MNNIYHIVNRGVDKRNIFLEESDYVRFVANLYKFNNKGFSIDFRCSPYDYLADPPSQNKIVDILKWSLLPNHFHLLIAESEDGGALEFIKRLSNGYTKYFNIKYKRSGYLFQSSTKIIMAENNPHFLYLPFYIDLNPVKIIDPLWKEKGFKDSDRAIKFLENYTKSSYRDYLDINNFPKVINKELFYYIFDTDKETYLKDLREWIDNNSQNMA